METLADFQRSDLPPPPGPHRQVLGNATTVMMRLTTGFGTSGEKHRDVILRLEEAKDDVLVGSFDVD